MRYQLLHRTIAALIKADRFQCTRCMILVHHFGAGDDENFKDFVRFTEAMHSPISMRNAISPAVRIRGKQAQLAWIDSEPEAVQPLTARDLVVALGRCDLLSEFDSVFASYWRDRLVRLGSALGLPQDWEWEWRRSEHFPILPSLAKEACTHDFFSAKKYTPLPAERKLYRRLMPQVKTAEAYLRERVLDYAGELLLTFWPLLRGKTVSERDLGLPLGPGPIDYI